MSVRHGWNLTIGVGLLAALIYLSSDTATAAERISPLAIGTQTIGLIAGPLFPIRVVPSQSSKLFGAATMPSWSMTLTDPIGSSWYQGQIAVGAELLAFGTSEPKTAYGIGVTPKLHYTFTSLDQLRPYIEGGGGPIWTDLGGRVPEQPELFNFVVWGGAGCTWLFTPQWALNVGYRFVHISNAGTSTPNSGLNYGVPFVGLAFSMR